MRDLQKSKYCDKYFKEKSDWLGTVNKYYSCLVHFSCKLKYFIEYLLWTRDNSGSILWTIPFNSHKNLLKGIIASISGWRFWDSEKLSHCLIWYKPKLFPSHTPPFSLRDEKGRLPRKVLTMQLSSVVLEIILFIYF